jgi:hypothetical protein
MVGVLIRRRTTRGAERRTRRTGRRARAVAALALSAGALAGCGVAVSSGPVALPKSQVPNGLLSPNSPPAPAHDSATSVPVQVYLLGPADDVEAVQRSVPKPTQILNVPAQLKVVLDRLLAGPTPDEAAQGYSTAIPAQTAVLSTSVASGNNGVVVTVNFNDVFGLVSGSAQVLAGEQVVLTVVGQIPGYTTGVLFQIDGVPTDIPVPRANGALVPGPVTVLDYLPPTPTPSTTTTTAPPTKKPTASG